MPRRSPAPAFIRAPHATYRVLWHIAAGGMADVFAVRRQRRGAMSPVYALKRLHRHLAARGDCYARMMLSEARVGARFDHPGLCAVYDAWRDGDDCCAVMEYADGVPLSRLVSRAASCRALREPRFVASLIGQACEALHYAHELTDTNGLPFDLVHRDISPSNLMVTYRGVVKVIDFGVAQLASGRATFGVRVGKWSHMAPEQVCGPRELTRRADVYSLGVVAAELALGRRLLRDGGPDPWRALTARRKAEELLFPTPIGPALSRALAFSPAERFDGARAFGIALAEAAGGTTPPDAVAALLRRLFGPRRDADRVRR